MNVLNFFVELYGKLHNYKGVPFWVLTPARKIVRGAADKLLPSYLSRLHKRRMNVGSGVIISFTSFPARINEVWKVVETLKNQSVKPERIILWLSKEQFPDKDSVPQSLRECEDGLFEIRLVDGDIRSHKKYYYAMQEYPDKTVVTCDDDIYYSKDMLKSLVSTAHLFPNCIIANTTKQILFDGNGVLKPYSDWDDLVTPYASDNRVQIGEGGVLYPSDCLHELVLRKDLIAELAPLADDLWLNLMARLKKTPVVQSNRAVLPLPIESEAPTLTSVNNGAVNMNDVQLQKMREWLKKEDLEDVYRADYHIDKPSTGG